jgi:oxygen-independent coproporphyrinogen-3 oxidase
MFDKKDNEFIAWYPTCVRPEEVPSVWRTRRAAYYVHIPFCTAICDYCAFAVESVKNASIHSYLDALEMEIARYAESGRLAHHRFECGHFGGGTPSVLEASDLLKIQRRIARSFSVASDAEITVEVNPISFDAGKASAYRDGGVNRISFGVQSFQDRLLKIIGRPHRSHDVTATLAAIQGAGYDNYSLDIIYGIPSQTLEELEEDLNRAADTGATHLSCFRLEIIPFTALKLREAVRELPARISLALLNEMDCLVSEVLQKRGFREYGAFNFARPGYESVHNAIAFVAPQGEYIGFGNSSYSFINGHIFCNYALISEYEDAVRAGRDPISLARRVSAHEEMSRFFVLGLKFLRVSRGAFVERFGLDPELLFGDALQRLEQGEMLRRDDDDWVVTSQGRRYINNMAKEFYVGESRGVRQHIQFAPTLTHDQILRYANKARQLGVLPANEVSVDV